MAYVPPKCDLKLNFMINPDGSRSCDKHAQQNATKDRFGWEWCAKCQAEWDAVKPSAQKVNERLKELGLAGPRGLVANEVTGSLAVIISDGTAEYECNPGDALAELGELEPGISYDDHRLWAALQRAADAWA